MSFKTMFYYKNRECHTDGWKRCYMCEEHTPIEKKYWSKIKCCNIAKELCRDCIKSCKKYYGKEVICPYCEKKSLFNDIKY